MALLCSSNCGPTANPPARYDGCADRFRKYGHKHFVLFACDYQFTDALNASEWATMKTNHDVHVSPAGRLIVNEPTSTTAVIDGELREVVTQVEYTVTFETHQTASDDSDPKYWDTFFQNAASYKLAWFDRNGLFTMPSDWCDEIENGTPATISGSVPAFDFSVTKVPTWIQGEGQYGKWVTEFKVKYNGVLRTVTVPGAIAAIL